MNSRPPRVDVWNLDPDAVPLLNPRARSWTERGLSAGVLFLLLSSACTAEPDRPGWEPDGIRTATAEMTLGAVDGPTEYLFSSILDLAVSDDGVLWVLERGTEGASHHLLRRYGTEGQYLGPVGRVGDGPGEYHRPYALGTLSDGRVVLRDQASPHRLLVYGPDGSNDTTWTLADPLHAIQGGLRPALAVDLEGVIWIQDIGRPGPERRSGAFVSYVRLNSDGIVLDTVFPPARPLAPRIETLAGVAILPFQPRSFVAWSPSGTFATGVTAEYCIRIHPPQGSPATDDGRTADPECWVHRTPKPIPVSTEERRALRAALGATVEARTGVVSPSIPNLPELKPALREVWFARDGRMWVGVSVTSEMAGAISGEPPSPAAELGWYEPDVYDVYDPSGQFLSRVVLPRDACWTVLFAIGDSLWCVARIEWDVEVVRRLRIDFGAPDRDE